MSSGTPRPPEPAAVAPRYPLIRRCLHWAIAGLVVTQFGLILVLRQIESVAYSNIVLGLHRQVGLFLLLLIVARLCLPSAWATSPSIGLPKWQQRAASAVHLSMLAILAAQPVLGLLTAWSRGDKVVFLYFLRLPALVDISVEQGATLEACHRWLAFGLLALLAVHIGAALFNHLVRKVPVASRMLSGTMAGRLTNRVPVFLQLSVGCGAILMLVACAGLYGATSFNRFNELRTKFDQVEVVFIDNLRASQLHAHDLLNARLSPQEMLRARRALAGSLRRNAVQFGDTQDVRNAEMPARLLERGIDTQSMQQAINQLDSVVNQEAMELYAERLEIAQSATEGHDAIILALLPATALGAALAIILSRSILAALAHARRSVREIGRNREAGALEIVGRGEFALLLREIIAMGDLVTAREAERAAQEAKSEAERAAREAAQVQREMDQDRILARQRAFVVDQLATALSELANGNLQVRLATAFAGQVDVIRRDFNSAISALEAAMQRISASSELIEAGCVNVTVAAEDLAARTVIQASNLGKSTHAIGCVAENLADSSRRAAQAATIIASTRAMADRSSAIVSKAIGAMDEIELSSQRISRITHVIGQLTRKTNMLAINAAIEAARAGPSGRGFAVIAQEVRSLAVRASDAGREIEMLIARSSANVSVGAGLVREAGQAFREIVDEVGSVDRLVAGIAASVEQQNADIGLITVSIDEVDRVVRDNALMAEQTVAALQQTQHNAAELAGLIRKFDVAVSLASRHSLGNAAALEPQVLRLPPPDSPEAGAYLSTKRLAAQGVRT